MRKLQFLISTLTLATWPLSLFLSTNTSELIRLAFISVFLLLSWKFFRKSIIYSTFILPVAILEPKLSVLPIFAIAIKIIFEGAKKRNKFEVLLPLAVSLLVLGMNWNSFVGQTVFKTEYEERQLLIRNQQLYPTVLSARVSYNKARVATNKIQRNLFEISDLNNYFFSFAPRQIIERGSNLPKFPFLSLPFFLIGLYKIFKDKKTILKNLPTIILYLASIISLSIINIYDKIDFVLYLPISLTMLAGISHTSKKHPKFFNTYFFIFTISGFIEIARIFFIYGK